ncbi:MAG: type II toxin-antitoxin system HicB family antitoxin [Planctomycetes bacterium]|nr:type II toxin-antitoxin system HicB family antitoxin [Planctomycetota bacterium]
MLIEYIQKAIEKASYKKLEDGTWFAEIPGFSGVWANGKTVESCRRELWDVLEEWIVLKLRDGDVLPRIGGVRFKIKRLKVG